MYWKSLIQNKDRTNNNNNNKHKKCEVFYDENPPCKICHMKNWWETFSCNTGTLEMFQYLQRLGRIFQLGWVKKKNKY